MLTAAPQLVMVGPIGDEYGEQSKHLLEKGGWVGLAAQTGGGDWRIQAHPS